MAGLHFDITADNTHFINSLNQTRNAVRATIKDIESQGITTEQYFNNIKQAATALAAGFSTKAFVSQMVNVRGEFQQLEVAFKTMLGSAEKADALMQQLTKTAAITPFDLQGVTNGAKQLLAYGISAEEVNDKLIHLGDIAAGLSLPLNDLVYLYGTTMTQGRMFTQDLRQFQGRGIPIAEELAKVFGTTKDKVGELVTAGKVGAKEFNQAIMAMSSEGGKFAGLMEAQSKTITGQISNIEDAIDVMFNDLGKQSEGIINGTLDVISSLVENYQKVGEVIGGLVATYGTYKAAVITVTALHGLQAAGVGALTAAETAHYGWIVLCEKAQKLLNATMLANPYVLAATAVAGLVAVMVTMKSEQERVNEAYDEYSQKKADIIRKEEEHKARIEELARVAGDETLSTETRRLALVELEQKYPAIFAKYDTEAEKLKHIRDLKAEIAALDGKGSITKASNELDNVEKRIKELEAIHTDSFINSAGGRTYTGRNRNESEEAELKALQRRRGELTNQIKKDEANTYLTNLTGISNADLEKQIAERRNLIARMDVGDKKYGKVNKGGATGVYTKDELQGQLQILQSEQSRRKKVLEDSTKDFVAEANKAYKKEQAALRKLESLTDPKKRSASKQEIDGKKVSEMSSDEFLQAVEKQQQAVAEAKKKVDVYKVKGDDKAGADAASRRQKQFELEQKEAEWKAAQKRELSEALEDAEIAGIVGDTEREIKERETQHKRKLQQIQDQADEWKKEAYKAAEERFNATNTDKSKTFADTDEGKAGWQGQKLSKEQTTTIEAQVKAENANHERAVKEQIDKEEKANAEAIRKYIEQFGDYNQQKQAIYDKANEEICELQEQMQGTMTKDTRQAIEARIALVRKGAEDEVEALDQKFGKTAHSLGELFADVSKKSVSQIDKLYKKYRAFMQYYTNDGNVSKKDLVDSYGFTEKQIDEVSEKLKTGAVSLKEYQDGLEKLQQLLNNKSPLKNFISTLEDVNKRINESLENGSFDKDAFGEGLIAVGDMIEATLPQLDKFGEAMGSIFHFDKSEYQDLVKGVESFGSIAKGVGQMYSGDYIGGAANAASGLAGMISIFSFEEEKLRDRQLKTDILSDRLSALNDSVQRLTNKMDEVYGVELLTASNEARQKAIEKQDVAIEELRNSVFRLGWGEDFLPNNKLFLAYRLNEAYGMGHDTEGRYYERNKDWIEAGYTEEQLFAHFLGQDNWEDLFATMTNEEIVNMLDDIKKNHEDWWAQIINMNEGYGEEYFNALIESYEQLEEIDRKTKESITQTGFDSVFGSFMSELENLASGSEDVFGNIADNWQKMVNKMVLYNLMGNKYKERLKDWYEMWEATYSDDNAITEQELIDLRKEYDDIVSDAAEEVRYLKDTGLLGEIDSNGSPDKSATYNSLEKWTYEQADELISRVTAMQIIGEHQYDIQQQILNTLQTKSGITTLPSSAVNHDNSMILSEALHNLAQNMSAIQGAVSEMRNIVLYHGDYFLDIGMAQKVVKELLPDISKGINDVKSAVKHL